MQRNTGRRIVPGLVVLLAAMAAEAAGPAPPARPPRQKLTLWDKEVYEGRRGLVDEDCYPRKPARLVEGPAALREGDRTKIVFALDGADDVLVRVVPRPGIRHNRWLNPESEPNIYTYHEADTREQARGKQEPKSQPLTSRVKNSPVTTPVEPKVHKRSCKSKNNEDGKR